MKQIIRLTESDLHSIIRNVIEEVIGELGPPSARKLGAVAARKRLRGENPSDVHKYAKEKGCNMVDFAIGGNEYMNANPDKVEVYARKKFHDNKKGS